MIRFFRCSNAVVSNDGAVPLPVCGDAFHRPGQARADLGMCSSGAGHEFRPSQHPRLIDRVGVRHSSPVWSSGLETYESRRFSKTAGDRCRILSSTVHLRASRYGSWSSLTSSRFRCIDTLPPRAARENGIGGRSSRNDRSGATLAAGTNLVIRPLTNPSAAT